MLWAFIIPLALLAVFFASLRTGMAILKYGNEADPLGSEIEEDIKDDQWIKTQRAASSVLEKYR